MGYMDKYKEDEIGNEKMDVLESRKRTMVMKMAERDSELLNVVYREISENMGMDAALKIYQMFRGQQISFPVRLFNPARIRHIIIEEYDGTNVRELAVKYEYSEKTIRRIIKDGLD